MNNVNDINFKSCFSYCNHLSVFPEHWITSQLFWHCMYLGVDNLSLEQWLRGPSQNQCPEGEGEMAREGGWELQSKVMLMPPPQVPSDSAVIFSCYLQKNRLEGGRHVVPWQSEETTPQQGGLLALQETPSLWLLQATQDTPYAAEVGALAQLVMRWHHWWRCPGLLASPVSPVLCGLCCDKPPRAEPHVSAVSDLAHKESFHSGAFVCFGCKALSCACNAVAFIDRYRSVFVRSAPLLASEFFPNQQSYSDLADMSAAYKLPLFRSCL